MKIIHITDPHVRANGARVRGIDTAARLAAVVDDIATRHADADLVVVTGDLVDDGEPASYAAFADIVRRLAMPVRLMIGNHDRRDAFRAAFPDHPVDGHGFVQSVLDAPGRQGRLLFLDSVAEGWIGGRICAARQRWIAARLAEAADQPALVFLHHPPLSVGVPHFEPIGLHEPDEFLASLRGHRGGIRHVVFGHIHIPVAGTFGGGLPFTAGRGCAHQIVVDFETSAVSWAAGAPNYGIIDLREDALFIHSFDFIGAEVIDKGPPCPGP